MASYKGFLALHELQNSSFDQAVGLTVKSYKTRAPWNPQVTMTLSELATNSGAGAVANLQSSDCWETLSEPLMSS